MENGRCFVAVNKKTGEINEYSAAGSAKMARELCTQSAIGSGDYAKGKKHAWKVAMRYGWRIHYAKIVLT
jgi:hypothetical protein